MALYDPAFRPPRDGWTRRAARRSICVPYSHGNDDDEAIPWSLAAAAQMEYFKRCAQLRAVQGMARHSPWSNETMGMARWPAGSGGNGETGGATAHGAEWEEDSGTGQFHVHTWTQRRQGPDTVAGLGRRERCRRARGEAATLCSAVKCRVYASRACSHVPQITPR